MDVDRGQLVYPSLKDVAIFMDLDELGPVGGPAAGGRHWRRFERFAQVGEDLPDRARLGDENDQPDVALTRRALERKLLAHPSREFGPDAPGSVVRAGLCVVRGTLIPTLSQRALRGRVAAGRVWVPATLPAPRPGPHTRINLITGQLPAIARGHSRPTQDAHKKTGILACGGAATSGS